jgi:hypothetical protein
MYHDAPDSKIKWRVWSFDEGLASRVPYEAAARTLTESQEKFSTSMKRDGLAITMEHNFMMTEQGRKNFYYRLMQVVGSIQKTNDMYVLMALINARSYFRKVREKYYRELKNGSITENERNIDVVRQYPRLVTPIKRTEGKASKGVSDSDLAGLNPERLAKVLSL